MTIPKLKHWIDLTQTEVYFIQQALEDERAINYIRSTRPAQVEMLEGQWTDLIHKPSVAVRSCSDAIFLALMNLGVGSGDAVLVPAYVFSETIEPVKRVGAIPIFVDVDYNGNLEVESAETIWNSYPHIKAMIVAHAHGCPARLHEIVKFCKTREIWLIEDCRYATGLSYKGQLVGTFGAAGCYSFTERPLIAGSGGMLCGDEALIGRVRRLMQHDDDEETEVVIRSIQEYTSINHLMMYKPDSDFRMSGVAAAIVRGLLMYRLKDYHKVANQKGKQLIERLCNVSGVKTPTYRSDHGYHQFKVQVEPTLRPILMVLLARVGLPVMQWGWRPIPSQPAYNSDAMIWPEASRMYDEQFMLFNDNYPLAIQSPEVIDWAADTFISALSEARRKTDV